MFESAVAQASAAYAVPVALEEALVGDVGFGQPHAVKYFACLPCVLVSQRVCATWRHAACQCSISTIACPDLMWQSLSTHHLLASATPLFGTWALPAISS